MTAGRSLADLPVGAASIVMELRAVGSTRRRLLDLGFVPDTAVEAVRRSPMGDPTAYQIRGAVIALRKEDADAVLVRPI
ncbi:MAG: ferrous iron transport protein A [Firmicutes bacterium]|jgi:ferrous iron transport protein A|nr:ferrous iron transport protein A [Bacillota bacterium]